MKNLPLFLLLLISFTAQSQNPPPPLQPLSPPEDPVGNPSSEDKIMLGKILFWEEQMSSTKTVACASCHIPSNGGSDPRSTPSNGQSLHPGADLSFGTGDDVLGSQGVPLSCESGDYIESEHYAYDSQVTGRKSPSAINAGFAESLFWDGRAEDQLTDPETGETVLVSGAALESQILGPPLSSVEMAHFGRQWSDVIESLQQASPLALSPDVPVDVKNWIDSDSYYRLFERVYGDTQISATRIAMAIAAYERSLYSNQAPIDDFIAGNNNALTLQERNGFNVFRTAGCAACHSGSLFTDNGFHNIGVTPNAEDLGRFEVTGNNADRGRFKTPSLRNTQLHANFMHNGGLLTLQEVIDFYNRGGDFNNPNLDPRIQPLNLNPTEISNLLAFLGRPLTDPDVANAQAAFRQLNLFSESDRMATIGTDGVAGTDGKVPTISAYEPALLGNKSFTLGVENAVVESSVFLVVDTSDPGTSELPSESSSLIFQNKITQTSIYTGDGMASFSLNLPGGSDWAGQTLFARVYITDDGSATGFATSPLISFTLFAPDFGTAGQIFSGAFEEEDTSCQ